MVNLVQRHFKVNGVRILTDEHIKRFEDEKFVKYVITNRRNIPTYFVVIAVGVKPNVELAKQCRIKLWETGAISVNENLQINDTDIYAIGDCVENLDMVTKSGLTANKQDRIAAGGRLCDRQQ